MKSYHSTVLVFVSNVISGPSYTHSRFLSLPLWIFSFDFPFYLCSVVVFAVMESNHGLSQCQIQGFMLPGIKMKHIAKYWEIILGEFKDEYTSLKRTYMSWILRVVKRLSKGFVCDKYVELQVIMRKALFWSSRTKCIYKMYFCRSTVELPPYIVRIHDVG